jgi:hypothetical protein
VHNGVQLGLFGDQRDAPLNFGNKLAAQPRTLRLLSLRSRDELGTGRTSKRDGESH